MSGKLKPARWRALTMAKYNQLIRIEEALGDSAVYRWGYFEVSHLIAQVKRAHVNGAFSLFVILFLELVPRGQADILSCFWQFILQRACVLTDLLIG